LLIESPWLFLLFLFWVGGFMRLLLNPSQRRNGHHFLRFQLFRLLGFTIAMSVTLGYGFFHDGPVAINPMPTIDDNFAAPANANERGGFLDSGTIDVEHVQQ
jgi:hypothetical protein